MNISKFAIKHPITIVALFLFTIFAGIIGYKKLSVDLFPNISFPIIVINTIYPGAGPLEIEQQITKPIEKIISTLAGVSSVYSTNKDSISQIIVKFTLDTDVKYAEQQVKNRISTIRANLPTDSKESIIRSFDPSEQPVANLSVKGDLSPSKMFDLIDTEIMPLLEQTPHVGFVEIVGGQKREIHVDLKQDKLSLYQISASQVVNQLKLAGKNVPAGKHKFLANEKLIRVLGEYDSLDVIKNTIIKFHGNENSVKLSDLADVKDDFVEIKSKYYVNGQPAVSLVVYKQSGANTVALVENVKKTISKIQLRYQTQIKNFQINVDRDGAKPIRLNIEDVLETILIGIILVILVVYFFLGSVRSTIITSIAIPNALIGAFVLMALFGFSINVMTLLAMSLAVGLLIDDAIVVRENIFRHMEMGKSALQASVEGTGEVMYAVLGVSITVLAVFGPVAFLSGIVGQFFKEFGLTICFIIIISTLDALGLVKK